MRGSGVAQHRATTLRGYVSAVILLATMCVTACGSAATTVTQPTPAVDVYSGTWSGTLTDTARPAGSVQLTLAQHPLEWSGEWSLTFSNSGVGGSAAIVPAGAGPAAPLVLVLLCPQGELSSADVKLTNGHLAGTFIVMPFSLTASTLCLGLNHGVFDLSRQ